MLSNNLMKAYQDHGLDIHKAVQLIKLHIKKKISLKIIKKKEN